MKKYKSIGVILLCILGFNANSQTRCASSVDLPLIQQVNPARYQRILALEQHTQNYINSVNSGNNTARLTTANSTIIIPVVVHVLHRGEAVGVGRNISDAQILSQVDVLNEDFRRLNADRVNTPAAFQPVAADPNFEFRLACLDPDGNPTTGITRTIAGITQFDPLGNVNTDGSINEQATGIKFTATGGIDAWATDRYLNIWVCDMGGGLIGYGQFPFDYSVKPTTDGVVMLFNAFGRVGNLQFGLDEGRVCVHETGHWLNLRHIWGDANCGNDFVDDTPTQLTSNTGCPAFPHVTCSNGANGDMFMNYMDYTNNGCQNIYTAGQSLRMRAVFAQGGPRAGFINNYFRINQPTSGICSTGTVTAFNPMCLPITWSVVSGPASIISGQSTNTITLQKDDNGQAVIRATSGNYVDEVTIQMGVPTSFTGLFGNYPQTAVVTTDDGSNDINSNQPTYVTFTSNEYIAPGQPSIQYSNMTLLQSSQNFPISPYQWQYIKNANFGQLYLYMPDDSWAYFQFTLSNACGGGTFYLYFQAYQGAYYRLSPNPAKDVVTVQVDEEKLIKNNAVKSSKQDIREIDIVDKLGNIVQRKIFDKGIRTVNLNTSFLKPDMYVVRIFNGKTWKSLQLLKQ